MPVSDSIGHYIHPRKEAPSWKVPTSYDGPVLIWDLDSTYLATEFSNLWSLMRTAFESPEKKKNISGAVSLIKHLRRDCVRSTLDEAPLFFVSASPPQMKKKILAKLRLDGVEPTCIYFKDQWRHMKRGEFKMLRNHVGYKLLQLIRIWYYLPKTSSLILFGDDKESDALTYSLFSDICQHRIKGRQLIYLLRDLGLRRQESITISSWQRAIPKQNPIAQTYIHLISNSDPGYYERFGSQLLPTQNALQIAVSEFFAGRLTERGVSSVAYEMHVQFGLSPFRLRKSIEDVLRRARLEKGWEHPVWETLQLQHLIDEKPQMMATEQRPILEVRQDPILGNSEDLKLRMKYYDEMQ